MKLTRQIERDVAILTLSGEIMGGPDDYQLFKDEIYKLIGQDVIKVVLDMAKVKRINSSGLGILISGYTSLKNKGGNIKLASINELTKGILVMTKLNTIFESYDSVDKAVASYNL